MTPEDKAKELVEKYMDARSFGIDGYVATRCGHIYSVKRGKLLAEYVYGKYTHVTLCVRHKIMNRSIHRLIAKAHVPNPLNKKYVHHKDGNKLNNTADNLEWVSPRENTIHAVNDGLYIPPKNNRPDMSIPVCQYDLSDKLIAVFPSAGEAHRVTGLDRAHITRAAKGGCFRKSGGAKKWVNVKTVGGFKWKYQSVKQAINNL